MATLIEIDKFPQTPQLMAAVNEQFANGVEAVCLVQGSLVVGTMLSRTAAQRAMARKVAEQWVASPEAITELKASLGEKPEVWE